MSNTESFKTIQPKSSLLTSHIAYYYFHETFSDDFQRTFTYYPNYRIALNVFKGSTVEWDEYKRLTLPSANSELSSIITFTRKKSREVHMHGRINKIGIIFEPLGFNHFIEKSLDKQIKATITDFKGFDKNYEHTFYQIFETSDILKKRDLLDRYFTSIYKEFNQELVSNVVSDILVSGGSREVQELAEKYEVHRKTLLRSFNKHICCSVKGFITLVKFRNALQNFKVKKGSVNFTQLAYESQYYDQSSFIKHIHSFTGINPSKLFLELDDFADQNTIWTLKPS